MKKIITSGVSFGLTSATITTLGLMMGLYSSTNSKMVVIGAILIIAVADSFSDALGVHISEESKNNKTEKEVWYMTLCTLLSKFVFALSYAIPFVFCDIKIAIVVDMIWGFILLSSLSYFIAKESKEKPIKIISEHLLIATMVIITTHYIGLWIGGVFK